MRGSGLLRYTRNDGFGQSDVILLQVPYLGASA